MKRIAALVTCVSMLFSMSTAIFASVDLSGMSYDELVELKDQINLAIWNSEEWQEVEVPQGIWHVGEDIPAGKWTVKCAPYTSSYMMKEADISWGESLNDAGTGISWNGRHDDAIIYNPDHEDYKEGSITQCTIDVLEGDYIIISDYYNSVIFMPYSGKPSLGFK